MIDDSENYLKPMPDKLFSMHRSAHTLEKLDLVRRYIETANQAVAGKGWSDRFFVDLFAGSGKNEIDRNFVLGSPLIALTTKHTFSQYRFNEIDTRSVAALRQRVQASEYSDRVRIFQEDANVVVDTISNEIEVRERAAGHSSFTITLLDPNGIEELHWKTIERLARIGKMDLIINVSTTGWIRSIPKGLHEVVNRYFGTDAWYAVYQAAKDATRRRRALLDFYWQRLTSLGYIYKPEHSFEYEVPVKNSREAQQYTLIFASKHPLGDHLWRQVVKYSSQRRLL